MRYVWFPEDRNAPDLLADGTEVDCKNLSKLMSGGHDEKQEGKNREMPEYPFGEAVRFPAG